ncbi:MAG TPA: hypothetical protein VGN17_04850 [Bryobacteraceae bacterium]|jgi:hypothetical protein
MADAITTGVADIGVPFFITVIFCLSYLLWAKLLHGGRLRIDFDSPSSVDDVAAVLLIFTSFIVTFLEVPLALSALSAIHDLDLSLPRLNSIWTSTTTMVVVFGCVALLLLLGSSWNKRPNQVHAWLIFRVIASLHLVLVGAALGLYASTLLHATPSLLRFQLFALSVGVGLVSYLGCAPIVYLAMGSKTKPVKYGRIIVTVLLCVSMALGIAFGIESSPHYAQGTPVVKAYYLSERGAQPGQPIMADALTEIPVRFNTSGWLPNVFNLISVDYDGSHIEHHDGVDYQFTLVTVDDQGNEAPLVDGVGAFGAYDMVAIQKQGFSRIVDYNNQSIILWIDASTLAARNTSGVALQAPVTVLLNDSQYNRTFGGDCNPNQFCYVDLNISNHLPVRVIDRYYYVTLLQTLARNSSACKFTNVSYDLPGWTTYEKRGVTADCSSPTECEVESHGNGPQIQVEFELIDGLINARYASFDQPVNLNMRLQAQC